MRTTQSTQSSLATSGFLPRTAWYHRSVRTATRQRHGSPRVAQKASFFAAVNIFRGGTPPPTNPASDVPTFQACTNRLFSPPPRRAPPREHSAACCVFAGRLRGMPPRAAASDGYHSGDGHAIARADADAAADGRTDGRAVLHAQCREGAVPEAPIRCHVGMMSCARFEHIMATMQRVMLYVARHAMCDVLTTSRVVLLHAVCAVVCCDSIGLCSVGRHHVADGAADT